MIRKKCVHKNLQTVLLEAWKELEQFTMYSFCLLIEDSKLVNWKLTKSDFTAICLFHCYLKSKTALWKTDGRMHLIQKWEISVLRLYESNSFVPALSTFQQYQLTSCYHHIVVILFIHMFFIAVSSQWKDHRRSVLYEVWCFATCFHTKTAHRTHIHFTACLDRVDLLQGFFMGSVCLVD